MPKYLFKRELLGSVFSFSVVCDALREKEAKKTCEHAFQECVRIEKTFSRFLPESELSLLNASCGEWKEVSSEFFLLLQFCKAMHQETQGAFDITIKSILDGWGYDKTYSLAEGTPGKTGEVFLQGKNMVKITAPIDFGAIGKGYCLDRIQKYFLDFENILLDAGGDIYARGKGAEGKGWKVLFEHPLSSEKAIGEVYVDDFFVASSSPLRRRWRNRHHLVHTKSASPAQETQSVYVQAKKGILADAFSTAFFVADVSQQKKLASSFSGEVCCLGKKKEGSFCTSNFQGRFYG